MRIFKIGFRKFIMEVETKNIEETKQISDMINYTFPKIKIVIIGQTK